MAGISALPLQRMDISPGLYDTRCYTSYNMSEVSTRQEIKRQACKCCLKHLLPDTLQAFNASQTVHMLLTNNGRDHMWQDC